MAGKISFSSIFFYSFIKLFFLILGYYPVDRVFPVSVSNSLSSSSGRQRHFYTETQLELLDAEFAAEQFPSRERRRRIAQQLNVTEKSVLVSSVYHPSPVDTGSNYNFMQFQWWFQNRRRRIRQQTKTLNSAGARNHPVGRCRQHRRSSPYATGQLQHPQGLSLVLNFHKLYLSQQFLYSIRFGRKLDFRINQLASLGPSRSLSSNERPSDSGRANKLFTDGVNVALVSTRFLSISR